MMRHIGANDMTEVCREPESIWVPSRSRRLTLPTDLDVTIASANTFSDLRQNKSAYMVHARPFCQLNSRNSMFNFHANDGWARCTFQTPWMIDTTSWVS